MHLSIVGVGGRGTREGRGHEVGTHGGQTAAAVDGAQHGAAGDVDGDASAHDTCREGLAAESTAAAEDVAIDIRGAEGTNLGGYMIGFRGVVADVHLGVAHHVAILAAAEDRAVDPAAGDVDLGGNHIGPVVEEDALVALTGTEEVAGDRVRGNLVEGARHTEGGVAAEVHHAVAGVIREDRLLVGEGVVTHVGHLVAAIDGGEDMAAGDVDLRVAVDGTCRLQPFARSIGEVARATAEDIAIEGVAVGRGASDHSTLDDIRHTLVGRRAIFVFARGIGKRVVGIVFLLAIHRDTIGPGVALIERSGLAVVPFVGGIDTVEVLGVIVGSIGVPTAANLTAADGNMGVALHVAVLAAAVDGALDESRASDGDGSAADEVQVGNQRVAFRVAYDALAATEDHAAVHGHLQHPRTHLAGMDFDRGETGTGGTRDNGVFQGHKLGQSIGIGSRTAFFIGVIFSGIIVRFIVAGERTHRSLLTTTIDIALHPHRFSFSGRDILKYMVINQLRDIQSGGATHNHLGIGGDNAGIDIVLGAVATAIDIVVHGAADQFDQRAGDGSSQGVILCEITAAVDSAEIESAGIIGTIDDDSDITLDKSILVASAIDATNLAASDNNDYISTGAVK